MKRIRLLILLATLLFSGIGSALPAAVGQAGGAAREDLVARVEVIRGLRFKRPVPWTEVSQAEMRKIIQAQVDLEYRAEEWPKLEATLKAFDLIPKKSNLRETLLILLEGQAVGLYDPREKRMVVGRAAGGQEMDELLGSLGIPGFSLKEIALAHELDHALTDQHFDLLSLPIEEKFHDDRRGAAMAVVEGDATWVMMQYLYDVLEVPAAEREQMGRMLAPNLMSPDLMSVAIPLYLRENLMSSYLYGFALVDRAHRSGGLKAVDGLYASPPESMEQVLHPEKYFSGDDPPVRFLVKLPPAWVEAGWTEYTSGVWGELNAKILLTGWGIPGEEALAAAGGWGGDAYVTGRGPKGESAWIWVTQWDTEGDALEFFRAAEKARDVNVTRSGTRVTLIRGGPSPEAGGP